MPAHLETDDPPWRPLMGSSRKEEDSLQLNPVLQQTLSNLLLYQAGVMLLPAHTEEVSWVANSR